MTTGKIDKLVFEDDWSDLTPFQEMPEINVERMFEYRRNRLREQNPYDCTLEAGMVVCIENYMGPSGERVAV